MSFFKKEISTTKGLIAIFGAAVVLFGGAFTYYYRTAPTTYDYEIQGSTVAKKTTAKTTTTTTATTDATKDWKTYTNSKYGFGLTFTDDWKNYTIKETVTNKPTNTDPVAYLQISVPSTNNKEVMVIYIFAPANYEAAKKDNDPGAGTLLGKNDSYTFAYAPNNGLHGEPDKTFHDLLIPNLAKTFKAVAIDVTADWKIYTNSTYGFSFKYPTDWELKEYKDETTTSVTKGTDVFAVNYYPSVSDEGENKSNHYGATTLDELVTKNPQITNETKTTFLGKNAYEVVWGGMAESFEILFLNNQNKFIAINFVNKAKKSDLTETQNLILSTFQFTK